MQKKLLVYSIGILLFLGFLTIFPSVSASPNTVTYYFDDYDPTGAWTSMPENMVDGDTNTFATAILVMTQTQSLISNTCLGTDLGTITKVEIRAWVYQQVGGELTFIPVFSSGDGDNHLRISDEWVQKWTDYIDITTDTNAPATWTFTDIQNLNGKIKNTAPSPSYPLSVAKIEIQVTYDEPVEKLTCIHATPSIESDGYLYMIYRDSSISISNLNLLMGNYTPFSVSKFNYTSLDWDVCNLTINTNDYIRVKINESDMPYYDTLISIIPQIKFNVTNVEDDKLDIVLTSNSSGSWEIVKVWSNVSKGWFNYQDSNMNEYNTTYYYSVNVTDSYSNNLISNFSFTTTITEPAVLPIIIKCQYNYIIFALVILICLAIGMYTLKNKKK